MELLAAAGIAGSFGKDLFSYNRENFKFDQDQRLERESLRLSMQVKRFELFREDVRDLVELTVDRMDVYHLVGALFLEFCIVLFCEGRVQASAPPFLLSLFLLSNACSFIYLLLAVWLSMHASIASHSFGVRLLTRFVRLPIPSIKQMNALTMNLKEYEKQGVANLLRMPFLDEKNTWYQDKSVSKATENHTENETKNVTLIFQPGKLGLDANWISGCITKVHLGEQGHNNGVQVGWTMAKVNGEEYSEPLIDRFIEGTSAYLITFNFKSEPLPAVSSSSSSSRHHKYTLPVNPDEANKAQSQPPTSTLERSASAPSTTGSRADLPKAEMLGRSVSASTSDAPRKTSTSPDVRPARAGTAGELLPEDTEHPIIGGEDILYGRRGLGPERHVQLFRQLQSKWQCYDAYCRVCMGLGVNLILQALSYFSICHTLVENRSPSTGYGMTVLFQATTIALAVLDLAGLKRREIFAIQLVGILPVFFTAVGVAHGARTEEGILDPEQMYNLSALAFFSQVIWLELWIRVAAPSSDKAKLPRRFRQVLFLDVFGDAVGWDPTVAEDDEVAQRDSADEPLIDVYGTQEDADAEAEEEAVKTAAKEASSQLSLAQWAIRRWLACPESILSKKQGQMLTQLRVTLGNWGATVRGELDRLREKGGGPAEFPFVYEPELRQLHDMDESERGIDPFAGCLVGPLQHDGGSQMLEFHYDVEHQKYLWQDDSSKMCPGALLLTLEAVATILGDLERDARCLLELRIMTDLKSHTRTQKALLRASQSSRLPSIQESLPQAANMINSVREANSREGNPVKALFPNVMGLFRKGGAVVDEQERTELLPRVSPAPSPELTTAAPMSATSNSRSSTDGVPRVPRQVSSSSAGIARDPTLVAMAGQHARHFVPERLPWQVLKGMTRVLQLCWGYAGFMALLKELKVYVVDFQQHPAHERRLLCPALQKSFEHVDIEWPHGSFFRPQTIFCDAGGDSNLFVGSPYALYSAKLVASQHVPLLEFDRSQLPPSSVLMCSQEILRPDPTSRFDASGCIFAAPVPSGLSFWPAGSSHRSASTINVALEGSSWRQLAGGIMPCRRLERLLPPPASWCMMLIGWDGEMLPIAVLPLPDGSMMPSADTIVRPSFDAPLFSAALSKHAKSDLDVVSLSFESQAGHLWAMSSHGELELWDLLHMRSLGHSKLSWPLDVGRFRPSALCESTRSKQMFVVGRSDARGPMLFSMLLDDELSTDRSFMAASSRPLQVL